MGRHVCATTRHHIHVRSFPLGPASARSASMLRNTAECRDLAVYENCTPETLNLKGLLNWSAASRCSCHQADCHHLGH